MTSGPLHRSHLTAGCCASWFDRTAPSAAGLNPARTEQVAAVATPLQGQSYAQLLYVDRGSLATDLVVSATQENVVTAASAATGKVRPAPGPSSVAMTANRRHCCSRAESTCPAACWLCALAICLPVAPAVMRLLGPCVCQQRPHNRPAPRIQLPACQRHISTAGRVAEEAGEPGAGGLPPLRQHQPLCRRDLHAGHRPRKRRARCQRQNPDRQHPGAHPHLPVQQQFQEDAWGPCHCISP
jgi:hypothetical protein